MLRIASGSLRNTKTYFAASSGQQLIDDLNNQLDDARERLAGTRRDAAVWKVLPHLIAQPIVNSAYLQKQIGLSKNQTVRALALLSDRGVLTARSGRQRDIAWERRGILGVLDRYAEALRRS